MWYEHSLIITAVGTITLLEPKCKREPKGECEDVIRYKVERGTKMLSSLSTEDPSTRVS